MRATRRFIGRAIRAVKRSVPWARIGELVGQPNLAVTENTYTHALTDETELDYENMLERDRA